MDATFTVALTGGIATGKSAAADAFRRCGATIADADVAARNAVLPGTPGLAAIAEQFGRAVLDASGALDRAAMRRLVFADAAQRRKLEAIVHPLVRAELAAAVRACATPYCVLVVPLLTEFRADYAFVDRVVVVDAAPDVQLARVMRRDNATRTDAQAVIAAQAPRAARLAIADDVIDNSGDASDLEAIVLRLHALYLENAGRQLAASAL